MSEWDYYFARINDAPASIFIDLGLRQTAPVESRPWLLWVWVPLLAARADGLASNEESARLNQAAQALDAAVSAACGAQLVARVTGCGRREFYFYAAEPGELAAAAAGAMREFPEYTHEFGSTFQPEWDQYAMLYPSRTNLERMRNRRLLEELAREGDVHELPRKVDHWLYFADEEGRRNCREVLEAIGFALEDETAGELADTLPYALVVSRVDSIDAHSINGITLELARLAGENRGDYDGWGCEATTGSRDDS